MVAAEHLNGPGAASVRRWAPSVASATMPLHADQPCGDVAAWFAVPGGCLLAIIDGLGHGPEAALAAEAALHALADTPARSAGSLPALMQHLNSALVGLRGAAVGLVLVQAGRLWHAGVGNTCVMRLRGRQMTRLPSQNGIVGGGLPNPVTVTPQDLAPGDWLLLFTDGLDERLTVPVQLPEWQRDPALLCLYLLQHNLRGRDDAGVLVMRVGAD